MMCDGKRVKAGLAGAGLLAALAATRFAASASETAVSVAGRELRWACPLLSLFGLPCPSCGMTRSVVFTLHGELGRAAALNPAGPLFVLGAILLAALLLFLAFGPRPRGARLADASARKLLIGASAYACLTTGVLFAHWVRAVS